MNNIIFFDGVCGLCNSGVDFLLKKDKNKTLLFASLQSQKAQELLPKEHIQDLNTFVFYHNKHFYTKSTAAIKTLYLLGGFWKFVIILKIVPNFLRDSIYDFVAKNRYKWFDKQETCRIPSLEERARFLD